MTARRVNTIGWFLASSLVLSSVASKAAGEAGALENPPKLIAESLRLGLQAGPRHLQRHGRRQRRQDLLRPLLRAHDVAGQMYCFDPATQTDQAPRRPDGSLRRKGHESGRPGQDPLQFRGVRGQALLRHPHRLLRHHRRHGEDGPAAAGLEALPGRTLPGLRHGHRQVRGPGHCARAARASSP